MKIAFRCDASPETGTGHVMRCLTLADALRANGAVCRFLCRQQPGHLLDTIVLRGHEVHALSAQAFSPIQDALVCRSYIDPWMPEWIVVDHYGLDEDWETALLHPNRKLMVIDDLANRHHYCNLLLDQTFGRLPQDYSPWVNRDCQVICGASHALLRPEFANARAASLKGRSIALAERLLISMGGVDSANATSLILEALQHTSLSSSSTITVILGRTSPWLERVRHLADQMAWPTSVLVDIGNMAELMTHSDIAIGAAGTTTWERCCLGLPSIAVVLADNQQLVADKLQAAGAIYQIPHPDLIQEQLPSLLGTMTSSPAELIAMSRAASNITDGLGTERVAACLLQ